MKLLIVAQKLDKNDGVLGFFHDWVKEFSHRFDDVTVICLQSGEVSLPDNVKVLGLGKKNIENKLSKWRHWRNRFYYLFNFYRYCWQERNNYDTVFIHMNQGYVIYGYWLWRLLGKKIGLWYAHGAVSPSLVLAEKMTDLIFTSTEDGLRLESKKRRIVGQGIDVDKFQIRGFTQDREARPFAVVTVGRISAVKNISLLIEVAEILRSRNFLFEIKIAGLPLTDLDQQYYSRIGSEIVEKNLSSQITFVGSIPNYKINDFYNDADLFINLSDTGSLDKAILEAMSCGLPVMSSNDSARKILPDKYIINKEPQAIAERIIEFKGYMTDGAELRQIVIKDHSLFALSGKVHLLYESIGLKKSLVESFKTYVRNNRWLVAVMLASLIISLTYSFYFHLKPVVDAKAYDKIAWNMVQGIGYREDLDVPPQEDRSIFRVGPGYEFFLAGVYLLFGRSYWIVWIINALMLSASAWLTFKLSRRILGDKWSYVAGLVAAALVGLSPDFITVASMLMIEIPGIFLLLIFLNLFFFYFNSQNKSDWLIALIALTLGITITFRTPALLLIIPLTCYFLWLKNWKHLVIVIVGVALVLLPWIIRNFQVYHYFIPTNLAYSIDLSSGNHSGSSGELEPFPVEEDLLLKDYGIVKGNQMITATAVKYIISHPIEFIKVTIFRTSIYFSFARPFAFWFHLHGWSKILTIILSSLYSVILFCLGFYGLYCFKDFKNEFRIRAWLFTAMLIMMPIAIVGIIVETRYRFLIYPFLAIAAGYGWVNLKSQLIKLRPLIIILIVLFANTLFDVWRNWERIIGKIGGA